MDKHSLVIFGNPGDYKKLAEFLNKKSVQVSILQPAGENIKNNTLIKTDIILYDKDSGTADIARIKDAFPETPVIILCGMTNYIECNDIKQVHSIYFKPVENFDHILSIIKKIKTRSSIKSNVFFEDQNYCKNIFETVRESIFIIDEQGIIEYANPAACETYGYTAGEFTGMPCTKLITPGYHNVFKKYLDDVKRTGHFTGETIDISKNGRKIFTQVRGSRVAINGVNHLIAIIRDVTIEKELLSNLSRFNHIIQSSTDMIAICTPEKKVTYINKAGLDLLGWDSFNGKTISDGHPKWAFNIVKNTAFPHAVKHGFWLGETALLNAKGETIPVSQLLMVHKSHISGEIEYISTMIRNITERKKAEKERDILIKTLEQQNAEMERFVYTVSHDLKAPLVTITGFINLLISETEKNKISIPGFSFADCVLRIKNSASKMSQLLDDLLNFSRAGRVVGQMINVNFYEIVKEAIDQTEVNLKNKNVCVKLKTGFPDVKCDRQRIVEVMVNLIDNAVKFTGNTNEPLIEIGFINENEHNTFFIKDNGIGIEKKYKNKIFELFERLDQSAEGTGVGLAVAKRIIEYHNCEIWADSDGLEKGSTFFFTLPPAE